MVHSGLQRSAIGGSNWNVWPYELSTPFLGTAFQFQFNYGNPGVGTIVIGITAQGWVALHQVTALDGVPGKAFTGNHQSGFAFLDTKTQGLAYAHSQDTAGTAAAPAVNDLEDAHPLLPGGVELGKQSPTRCVQVGLAGFEIEGFHG